MVCYNPAMSKPHNPAPTVPEDINATRATLASLRTDCPPENRDDEWYFWARKIRTATTAAQVRYCAGMLQSIPVLWGPKHRHNSPKSAIAQHAQPNNNRSNGLGLPRNTAKSTDTGKKLVSCTLNVVSQHQSQSLTSKAVQSTAGVQSNGFHPSNSKSLLCKYFIAPANCQHPTLISWGNIPACVWQDQRRCPTRYKRRKRHDR